MEEKVNQKGAGPREEARITRPKSPMKNFVERFFQPVMEYLLTRDQAESMTTLPSASESVHYSIVKCTFSRMSRDKKVKSTKCRVQSAGIEIQ